MKIFLANPPSHADRSWTNCSYEIKSCFLIHGTGTRDLERPRRKDFKE